MKTHFKKEKWKNQKHQEEIGTNMAIVMFMVEAETSLKKKEEDINKPLSKLNWEH
jgi:prefoldin subunit 5